MSVITAATALELLDNAGANAYAVEGSQAWALAKVAAWIASADAVIDVADATCRGSQPINDLRDTVVAFRRGAHIGAAA